MIFQALQEGKYLNNCELDFADVFSRIVQIEDLHSELTSLLDKVILETGLGCPKGCRSCCLTPAYNIEVSLLEFLPLSLHLWRYGLAERLLQRLEETGEEDPCVLFERNSDLLSNGGCTFYEYRPMMCRLFGISAMIGKTGEIKPVVCKIIKAYYPSSVQRFLQTTEDGSLVLPVFSHFRSRIEGIDPHLAERVYPINMALKRAIEFIGLRWNLCSLERNRPA